jgi:hypothetical protein
MRKLFCGITLIASIFLTACQDETASASKTDSLSGTPVKDQVLTGTWKLISGTLIEKGDTTITDYTSGKSFIKIINDTHFAFLLHDLKQGKDSSAMYSSGGGTYTLADSTYTEHLEYCSDRNWEGHDFPFTITISNDTLTQQGREKIEASGIDRLNIERYVRVKK